MYKFLYLSSIMLHLASVTTHTVGICRTPLLVMVQSDRRTSEGPYASAEHQLWCVGEW